MQRKEPPVSSGSKVIRSSAKSLQIQSFVSPSPPEPKVEHLSALHGPGSLDGEPSTLLTGNG